MRCLPGFTLYVSRGGKGRVTPPTREKIAGVGVGSICTPSAMLTSGDGAAPSVWPGVPGSAMSGAGGAAARIASAGKSGAMAAGAAFAGDGEVVVEVKGAPLLAGLLFLGAGFDGWNKRRKMSMIRLKH